jgi:transcriptional regulator with XRE-family HTH domain
MGTRRPEELGAFLRACRDALRPGDVGLQGGSRRRVPGLRREEVAVLADVGTSWYTWLEQGRSVQPSVQVLDALAQALRMTGQQRRHLFALAGVADPSPSDKNCAGASERSRLILEGFEPWPAVMFNHQQDAVDFNRPFRFLVDDLLALPRDQRNCAWLNFFDPRWIAGHEDHRRDCAAVVSKLRASYARSLDDPAWEPFLRRMRAGSSLFAELWDLNEVTQDPDRVVHLANRHVGLLSVSSTLLSYETTQAVQLRVYTPADAVTRARLGRLAEMLDDGRLGDVPGAA